MSVIDPRVIDDAELLYVNISNGKFSTVVRDNATGDIIEIPGGEVTRIDPPRNGEA